MSGVLTRQSPVSLTSSYDQFCDWAYGTARAHIAPATRNSQYAYRDALRTCLTGAGRWLDVGCGHDLLPSWMPPADRALDLSRWHVAGVDLDRSAISRHTSLRWPTVGNIEALPYRANTFNLVTANMVVEHVVNPVRLFAELGRVLTPGGTLIVHTPNVDGYTTRLTRWIPTSLVTPLAGLLLRRRAEDLYPTHYRANSRQALQAAAGRGSLVLRSFEFVNSSPQLVRVPPLMLLEVIAMRAMDNAKRAHHRACILATLEKVNA